MPSITLPMFLPVLSNVVLVGRWVGGVGRRVSSLVRPLGDIGSPLAVVLLLCCCCGRSLHLGLEERIVGAPCVRRFVELGLGELLKPQIQHRIASTRSAIRLGYTEHSPREIRNARNWSKNKQKKDRSCRTPSALISAMRASSVVNLSSGRM